MRTTTICLLALPAALGHGNMLCPLPRQYRDIKPYSWTHWQGVTVPGDMSFNGGQSNAANLNAGIGGGGTGTRGTQPGSHGLCGDNGQRNAFNVPALYGPTDARGTYVAGGTMSVMVRVTAYHAGWFEFRLAVPPDGGSAKEPVTQALLNEHVLEIDESTPDYPAVVNYAGMGGMNGNGGPNKCSPTGGHVDSTASSPNSAWPHGTCCNGGGACSPPQENKDRYIIEFAGSANAGQSGVVSDRVYTVVLKVPSGIECERCTLQWAWTTANSDDNYPEARCLSHQAACGHRHARLSHPRAGLLELRRRSDQAGGLCRRDGVRRAGAQRGRERAGSGAHRDVAHRRRRRPVLRVVRDHVERGGERRGGAVRAVQPGGQRLRRRRVPRGLLLLDEERRACTRPRALQPAQLRRDVRAASPPAHPAVPQAASRSTAATRASSSPTRPVT